LKPTSNNKSEHLGTIRKYKVILILAGFMIALFVINPWMKLEDRVLLKIYRADFYSRPNLYKIIGRIPKSYKEYFVISKESNAFFTKLDITNKSDFTPYNYSYIIFKQKHLEGFLYTPPYFRCMNKTMSECKNSLSFLIDNDLFNAYVKILTKDSINNFECEKSYLRFLKKAKSKNDSLYYLHDSTQLLDILKQYPQNPYPFRYYKLIKDAAEIRFITDDQNKYIWSRGIGLFHLQVTNCHIFVELIGHLGNEQL
jgi:hypothetical protein